jgi:dipeptidyl aminopeptidase/acylaminoacyl peptidase
MRSLVVGLLLLGLPQAARAEAAGGCSDLLPPPAAAIPSVKRTLRPVDLVRLRDIDPSEPGAIQAHLFTRSPDGTRAAFQLRRADPERNSYCLGMVVLPLQPGGQPILVDRGGEFLRAHYDFRGKADFPMGVARVITPRWSADGHWIAFLKRENGLTQVWRAEADGSGSRPLTSSKVDVEDFRLSADGRTLLYTSRPALAAAYQRIETEGLRGYHFDDRFAPTSSNRPYPLAPVARIVTALDLQSGRSREATEQEAAVFPSLPIFEIAGTDAWTASGRRAWIEVPKETFYASRGRLIAEARSGRFDTCADAACADAMRPWWTAAGHVRFLHREGWANASTAIYDWTPGASAPRRLYVTDDVLVDCAADHDDLICLREGSLVPRRLERLDPASGRRTILFDPNPEFGQMPLGKVERLHLRNAFDLPFDADLVLPVGYQAGKRYPLVVVQYDTRGFLRGGTGDDFPIQAFANDGYAVLSVGLPDFEAPNVKPGDILAGERGNLAQFANRRSEVSALEVATRLAIDRGIADPKRIGLTGMSDGATSATYAVLHSKMFAAISITACCFDETFPARVGPAAARYFANVGYPKMTDRSAYADHFWSEISLVRNASSITIPILIQVSDDELMSTLPTFTALREVDAPIDMFVLPGEHHVKWQPAHRLAIYQRSLDWFDYWLKGEIPADTARQADVRYWTTLGHSIAVMISAKTGSGK